MLKNNQYNISISSIFKSQYFPFFLGLIIILLYLSPVLIQWKDAPVLSHDCLDSIMVYYDTLIKSGEVFGSNNVNIEQMMGGIPRNLFPSEFNILTVFFIIFDPITVFFLNFSIIHVSAFLGMYFLLFQFVTSNRQHIYIISGVACCYSLLPFYPSIGLCIAGLPLVLLSFISIIRNGWSIKSLILLIFYPFYSTGVYTGYFIIFIFFLTSIIISFFKKKIVSRGFIATFILSILIIICDYRLIGELLFDNSFVSHRYDFSLPGFSFINTLQINYELLSSGQYHAVSLHQLIVPLVWISLCLIIFNQVRIQNKNIILIIMGEILSLLIICRHFILPLNMNCLSIILWISLISLFLVILGFIFTKRNLYCYSDNEKIIILLLTLIFCISFFYQISSWNSFIQFKSLIPILKGLQLRFYFLSPCIWYILFAVCSFYIISKVDKLKWFIYCIIIIQIVFLFSFHGDVYQSGGYGNLVDSQYSFNEFFSSQVFETIKNDIGLRQNTYRVASLGIHPSISLYNGFYTIDGYFYNYNLSYKRKFREVISPELTKSEVWRNYYDGWGNRAYIFSSELNTTLVSKNQKKIIHNLQLNSTAFSNLGGKYLFSSVKIDPDPNGFTFKKMFTSEKSPWEIWVYELNQTIGG